MRRILSLVILLVVTSQGAAPFTYALFWAVLPFLHRPEPPVYIAERPGLVTISELPSPL